MNYSLVTIVVAFAVAFAVRESVSENTMQEKNINKRQVNYVRHFVTFYGRFPITYILKKFNI